MTTHEDDLDIAQLVRVFWKYKASNFLIIFISIFFGVSFSIFYKHKYEVSVETTYNYFPLNILQQCNSNTSCMKELYGDKILSALEFEWDQKRNKFSYITYEPLKEREYYDYFDKLNSNFINQMNSEILSFNDYIELNNLKEYQNELITQFSIYSKTLSDQINTGTQPVAFHSLIVKKNISNMSIIVFAFIVGLFLSAAQSLFRNKYKNI